MFYDRYGVVPTVFPASPSSTTTSPLPDKNQCAVCKTPQKVTACTGCRVLHYCGTAHQKSHWPSHNRVCKAVKTSTEQVWMAMAAYQTRPGRIRRRLSIILRVESPGSRSSSAFSLNLLTKSHQSRHLSWRTRRPPKSVGSCQVDRQHAGGQRYRRRFHPRLVSPSRTGQRMPRLLER